MLISWFLYFSTIMTSKQTFLCMTLSLWISLLVHGMRFSKKQPIGLISSLGHICDNWFFLVSPVKDLSTWWIHFAAGFCSLYGDVHYMERLNMKTFLKYKSLVSSQRFITWRCLLQNTVFFRESTAPSYLQKKHYFLVNLFMIYSSMRRINIVEK